jgi:tetratricopeptide (TPR) repeat protein
VKSGNRLIVLVTALLLGACAPPEQRTSDYLVKAQKFYADGNYAKARIEAQNAAQIEPNNAKARYLLALVAEQEKDYKAMFGHLQVAVVEDPANVEARLKIGTLYFLGQAWPQTAEQATALLRLAPKDARAHLLQARVLLQKGEKGPALAEIATALKLDPRNWDAILLQSAAEGTENFDKGLATLDAGIARLEAGEARPLREFRIAMLAQGRKTAELEQGLRTLSEDFPGEASYQIQLAQFYASQGRADEADRLLKSLTERDPRDTVKQLGYVRFLASQQDGDRAEAALRAFIEQNPDAAPLHLALGGFLEARERPDEARAVYQGLAERNPKTVDGLTARNRIAALAVRAGKPDEGRALLEGILADAPADPSALLLRAGLKFQEKKFDDSIADLRTVLRNEPANERALLLLAQAFIDTGDIGLAKETYGRLLELNPRSGDGLRRLASLQASTKQFQEAETLLRKWLETQPDDLVTSGLLVDLLLVQGQKDKAEVEARRMASRPNQAGIGEYVLGRVLVAKKDNAGAAEAFRKSLAARPDHPLPLRGLVQSLVAARKSNEAIRLLNEQVDNGQQPLHAKLLLGGVYAGQGDVANAERLFGEVLQDQPDNLVAWVSLADLYPKDRDARIRAYERGLQANPGNADLSILLGTEFDQSGRFDEAIAVFENMLRANPGSTPAVNNLAALLLDHRTDKASIARAIVLVKDFGKSDNPAMLDTLGWAHYRAGQYPQAVSVLERVVAKAGQVPLFRYHLGMAYVAAGDPSGAKQQLKLAVEGGDGYPGLEEARLTLKKVDRT